MGSVTLLLILAELVLWPTVKQAAAWCDRVTDGPRNVTVHTYSDSTVFKNGDWLTCLAEGSPTPTYYWSDAATGQYIHRGLLFQFAVTIKMQIKLRLFYSVFQSYQLLPHIA